MIKKLLVNIILIIFILVTFDISMFYLDTRRYYKFPSINAFLTYYTDFYKRPTDEKYLYNKYILGLDKKLKYRRVVNHNSKEKPILLFGASFVYGHNIPKETVSSEFFGKYLNNPIYNRSYKGIGPQLMLLHLQNEKFYKQIEEPKYVIYTIDKEDINRLTNPTICSIKNFVELKYDYSKKEDKLTVRTQNNLFFEPFTICNLKKNLSKEKKEINLFKKFIFEAKEQIDIHWKNTKFILFIYREVDYTLLDNIEQELKENGIIIIKRKDIAPFDDYDLRFALSKTDDHPNEYAWDYVVPKLMKEIERQTKNK